MDGCKKSKKLKIWLKCGILIIYFLIGFVIPLSAQKDYSPVVLYWKTLTQEEKQIYLFAYLTQIYDTHTSLIKEKGYGDLTNWYFKNRAELAYQILDKLERTDISKFVEWVDDFYSHDEYKDKPFYEALRYAYIYSQMEGESMLEKYESLLEDTSTKNP